MTVDFNEADVADENFSRFKKLSLIGAAVGLLVIIAIAAFVAYTKFIAPRFSPAEATAVPVATPVVVPEPATIDIGQGNISVMLPVYPGATEIAPPENTPVGDTRVFFSAPDERETVISWYRNELVAAGYMEVDAYYEQDIKINRFDNDTTSVFIYTVDNGDGRTGFSLVATQLAAQSTPPVADIEATPDIIPPTPVAAEGAPTVQVTLTATPVITASATSALTDTGEVVMNETPLQFDITASEDSLYAGTLTKYAYDITLTGHTTATITSNLEIVLPTGITLIPGESGGYDNDAYHIRYAPAERTVRYTATFAPGQKRRITLTVVTDLFIKPGELLLKGYLSSPGSKDKQLAVHKMAIVKK